jgi:phosphohistidine phosphatase
MDLLLVRHGVAWERDRERWPDDDERPLRPLGVRRMRAAARGLARLQGRIDLVWTSAAVRAAQTATLLYEDARWPAARPTAVLAENAPAMGALAAIARVRDVATLAVVGHAPQLDVLITLAVSGRQRPLVVRLKKGGVACVRFQSTVRAGAGTLLWAVTPRWLRALDE